MSRLKSSLIGGLVTIISAGFWILSGYWLLWLNDYYHPEPINTDVPGAALFPAGVVLMITFVPGIILGILFLGSLVGRFLFNYTRRE